MDHFMPCPTRTQLGACPCLTSSFIGSIRMPSPIIGKTLSDWPTSSSHFYNHILFVRSLPTCSSAHTQPSNVWACALDAWVTQPERPEGTKDEVKRTEAEGLEVYSSKEKENMWAEEIVRSAFGFIAPALFSYLSLSLPAKSPQQRSRKQTVTVEKN